jgi:hypothetical protein
LPKSASVYSRRESLLSQGELAFYRVLRSALAGRFAISIKTRLADVVLCSESHWESSHGRKVSQKHLDFVLYDPQTTRIVAAIELDDRSHEFPERKRRDKFVNDALLGVGVAIVRIQAARTYAKNQILSRIESAIALSS